MKEAQKHNFMEILNEKIKIVNLYPLMSVAS